MTSRLIFNQLNIVVDDMDAAAAFYRLVGLDVNVVPGTWPPGTGGRHGAAPSTDGALLDLDNVEMARVWGDAELKPGTPVIGFGFSSRADVDETFARLTAAGYKARLEPYDAFFGARYAMIDDPDGHPVGLMSPINPDLAFVPDSSGTPAAEPARSSDIVGP